MNNLPWFRLHHRIIHDSKLKLLAFEDRWHFVALMSLKASGELDEPDFSLRCRMAAMSLGLASSEFDEVVRRLQSVKLIDEELAPVNWEKLQSRSDSSAERTRKYRAAKKTTQKQGCDTVKRHGDVTVTVQKERERENNITPKGVCASGDAPDFTISDFQEAWNAIAAECGLARIRKLTDARKRAFRVRVREYPDMADWQSAFRCLRENKWMHGDNRNGWRADPDFFLQAKSFTKLVEGSYAQAD